MGLLLDLFENLRKTKSDVKKTKPQPRRYDFDAGFSGSKKEDYRATQIKEQSNSKKTEKDDERDER